MTVSNFFWAFWLQIISAVYTVSAVTWMVLRIKRSVRASFETKALIEKMGPQLEALQHSLVQVIEMDSRVRALEATVYGWRD